MRIMPGSTISFISGSYEGSISDRRLVELSGLLKLLEPGDEIMADKGFLIQDLLAPIGVILNSTPLLQFKSEMPTYDVVTRKYHSLVFLLRGVLVKLIKLFFPSLI